MAMSHIKGFSLSKGIKCAAVAGVGLSALWAVIGVIDHWWDFRDDADGDKSRAAIIATMDHLGDHFESVSYLDQGWDNADSLWFYNTTQGSDLLPYDFFLHLEQADSELMFRDNANMNRYRYLPQKPSLSNPDGLPVGLTKDSYKDKDYFGFTCAACHTSQLNFEGQGIRIDGGPAIADLEGFMHGLADALESLNRDKQKRERFISAVRKEGNYNSVKQVESDLERFSLRVATYNLVNNPRGVNRPLTHYGYARLDAFGRIFNRVLEHIMSADQIRELLTKTLTPAELDQVMQDVEPILSADDRNHIIARIQKYLSPKQLLALRNEIYNPADAPVSYPFLWDIPVHDYVQWNGVVQNSGIGPLGRNAGQVIGVFGTLDWREEQGSNFLSWLGGQSLGSSHINFESSLDIRNLYRVEKHLRKLTSPAWPEDILGKIDQDKAFRGEKLFSRYCASCHDRIDSTDPKRRVIAHMSGFDEVQTDPKMAVNSVSSNGYSGIIKGQYVDVGVGDILLQKQSPGASLLKYTTRNVVLTPDPDKYWFQARAERAFDFLMTYFDNQVKPSIKRGSYTPATTTNPFSPLLAYKGRPLNGIWATAPYLHNGSVPTLYHLLLPQKRDSDPVEGEYRPNDFMVGSREFNADLVGMKWQDYPGFKFKTHIPGNHNQGHEYAAGRTPQPDGMVLPAMNESQRWDLVEYLKTL
jgi:RoxA-like, cytochrome c-like